MAKTVPPVKGGKVIGHPYQGTHGRDFNRKGGSNNWESENAVDISVPVGTPIYAVTDGTIGKQFGSLGSGGRFAGLRLHLDGKGDHYYYAHLSRYADGIQPGAHVKAGQVIGYSGEANGVAHLHFAVQGGTPETYVKGLPGTGEAPVTDEAATATSGATTPDATGQVQPVDSSGGTGPGLQAAIGTIPQVGGAPQAGAPLAGAVTDNSVQPLNSAASTWQLIASNGNVSPDTIRLAQLASLGQ